MRWQREKQLEGERRTTRTKQGELEGCTFQPKINKNSIKAMKIIRGTSNSSFPNSRNSDSRHSKEQNSVATTNRLYESNMVLLQQKNKLAEEEKYREEKIHKQECTFQPRLSTRKNSQFATVDPRYDKVRVLTIQELKEKEKEQPPPKDCTFTPKVRFNLNCV